MKIILEIAGTPAPKGRPRTRIITPPSGKPFASIYTPSKTRKFESEVRYHAQQAMGGRAPIDEACRMIMTAYLPVPRSWSKKKTAAALAGTVRPTSLPDLTNLVKAAEDGCNKVIYRDDSLIVEGAQRKMYSDRPRLVIQIETLAEVAP